MEITFFEQDELGSTQPVELGKGVKLMISYAHVSGAPMPLIMGNYAKYENLDLKVAIEGWKTPTPTFPSVAQPSPLGSFSSGSFADMQNRDILIAALVNMLGGAVTVQPSEIQNARRLHLESYETQDPYMLVIKTQE